MHQVDPFGAHRVLLATQVFEMIEMCGIGAKNRYRPSPPDNPVGGTFLFAQENSKGCEVRRLTSMNALRPATSPTVKESMSMQIASVASPSPVFRHGPRVACQFRVAERLKFILNLHFECLQRICCSPCRSFTMNVHQGENKHGPVVLSLEKATMHCPMVPWPVLLHPGAWCIFCPWICVAFAGNPPEIQVKRAGVLLGTITDPPGPLFCCKANFLIRFPMRARQLRHRQ